jgi:hypothetical protein
MKSGILAAYLAAVGIVGWRIVHQEHRLPAPGVFLGVTGLFLAGALVSEWVPRAESLVLALTCYRPGSAGRSARPKQRRAAPGDRRPAQLKPPAPARRAGEDRHGSSIRTGNDGRWRAHHR